MAQQNESLIFHSGFITRSAPVHKIAWDSIYSCTDKIDFEKLVKNQVSAAEREDLLAYDCTEFKKGDEVYVVADNPLPGFTIVRRSNSGDLKDYWTYREALS